MKAVTDMSVEEAAELYDLSERLTTSGHSSDKYYAEHSNLLLGKYNMRVYSMTELIESLAKEEIPRIDGCGTGRKSDPNRYFNDTFSFYTTGGMYLARNNKGIIELVRIGYIDKKDWKKPPRKDDSYRNLKHISARQIQLYGQEDKLNLDKVAKDNIWHHGFYSEQNEKKKNKEYTISLSKNTPPVGEHELPTILNSKHKDDPFSTKDMSNLAIWEEPENFNKFLSDVEKTSIDEDYLKKHGWSTLKYLNSLGKKWKIVIPSLRLSDSGSRCIPEQTKYFMDINNPLRKDAILRVSFEIPNTKSLEGIMLEEFTKPSKLESGVITMSEDRIPLYLKRRLGLGEK